MPDEPPFVPVEVMPPQRGHSQGTPPPLPPSGSPTPRTPFHPAAATMLLVFDNLWMLEEFLIVDWIITVPLCFLCVFGSTLLIQRRWQRDRWATALWKAMLLGVIAAVPFSVTGTPVGIGLLAWFGIKKWKE